MELLKAITHGLFFLLLGATCVAEPESYFRLNQMQCWARPNIGVYALLTCKLGHNVYTVELKPDELEFYRRFLVTGTPPSPTKTTPARSLSLKPWDPITNYTQTTSSIKNSVFTKETEQFITNTTPSAAIVENGFIIGSGGASSEADHKTNINDLKNSYKTNKTKDGANEEDSKIDLRKEESDQLAASLTVASTTTRATHGNLGRASGSWSGTSNNVVSEKCCCLENSTIRTTMELLREENVISGLDVGQQHLVVPAEIRTATCSDAVCGRTATTYTHCEQAIGTTNVSITLSGVGKLHFPFSWKDGCTCSIRWFPESLVSSSSSTSTISSLLDNKGNLNDHKTKLSEDTTSSDNLDATNTTTARLLLNVSDEIGLHTRILAVTEINLPSSIQEALSNPTESTTAAVHYFQTEEILTSLKMFNDTRSVVDEHRLKNVAKLIKGSLVFLTVILDMFSRIRAETTVNHVTEIAAILNKTSIAIEQIAAQLLDINKQVSLFLPGGNYTKTNVLPTIEKSLDKRIYECSAVAPETVYVTTCPATEAIGLVPAGTASRVKVFTDFSVKSEIPMLQSGENQIKLEATTASTFSKKIQIEKFSDLKSSSETKGAGALIIQPSFSDSLVPKSDAEAFYTDSPQSVEKTPGGTKLHTLPDSILEKSSVKFHTDGFAHSEEPKSDSYSLPHGSILVPGSYSIVTKETIIEVVYVTNGETRTTREPKTSSIAPQPASSGASVYKTSSLRDLEVFTPATTAPGLSDTGLHPSFTASTISDASSEHHRITPPLVDMVTDAIIPPPPKSEGSLLTSLAVTSVASRKTSVVSSHSIVSLSSSTTPTDAGVESISSVTDKFLSDLITPTELQSVTAPSLETEGKEKQIAADLLTLDLWCAGNGSRADIKSYPDDFATLDMKVQFSLMTSLRKFVVSNIINDLNSSVTQLCEKELNGSLPLSNIPGTISGSMKGLTEISGLTIAVMELAHCVNLKNDCKVLVGDVLSKRLAAAQHIGNTMKRKGLCSGINRELNQKMNSDLNLMTEFKEAVEWSQNSSCSNNDISKSSATALTKYQANFKSLAGVLGDICTLQSALNSAGLVISDLINKSPVDVAVSSIVDPVKIASAVIMPSPIQAVSRNTTNLAEYQQSPTKVILTPNPMLPSEFSGEVQSDRSGISTTNTVTPVPIATLPSTQSGGSLTPAATEHEGGSQSPVPTTTVAPVTPFDVSRIQNRIINKSPDKLGYIFPGYS